MKPVHAAAAHGEALDARQEGLRDPRGAELIYELVVIDLALDLVRADDHVFLRLLRRR